MRNGILWQLDRKLTRGAAVLLVGGLAAGCSSQVDRFSDSLFTGSTTRGNQHVASSASQPYPGDNVQTAQVDGTYTGSVGSRVGRPDALVGGGGISSAPVASRQAAAPLPAPSGPASVSPVESRPLSAPTYGASGGNAANQPPRNTPASNGSGGERVTVRSGDTVYGLSRRYGVPASAIMAANGLQGGSGLQTGQTVLIPRYAYSVDASAKTAGAGPADRLPEPGSRPKQSAAVSPQTPRPEAREETSGGKSGRSGGNSYTVASGDTLYGISAKTGVSVDRLKDANNLSNGYLSVGQTLVIPAAGSDVSVKTADAGQHKVEQAPAKAPGAPEEKKVASYTPPKSDSVGNQVSGNKEAAAAPDSTGIGKLRWPVRGRVISAFHAGSAGAAGDGIDIAVPEGTPVKAAENGVVIYAGDGLKEFGKTVLVRHDDGLVTVYGYTGDIKVARGDTVKRGQQIAVSGMSGSADRPKLHFEVRKDATPVDPKTYLD